MLSGYLDGELTQGDRQRVEVHLESCAECRTAYEELVKLRGAVGGMQFERIPAERWSRIMSDLPSKGSRVGGWVLFLLGCLILCAYGVYELAVDETVSALVKTGVAALLLGLLFLFFSVLRERLAALKRDRYKDIQI